MKKICRRKAKKNSGMKKQSREQVKDSMSNGMAMITHPMARLI